MSAEDTTVTGGDVDVIEAVDLEKLWDEEVECQNPACNHLANWNAQCIACKGDCYLCYCCVGPAIKLARTEGITCVDCGMFFPAPAIELIANWHPI